MKVWMILGEGLGGNTGKEGEEGGHGGGWRHGSPGPVELGTREGPRGTELRIRDHEGNEIFNLGCDSRRRRPSLDSSPSRPAPPDPCLH